MRKLIYMSLAALALQTCVNVQASSTSSPTPAPSQASVQSSPTSPSVPSSSTVSPLDEGHISFGSQVGAIVERKVDSAAAAASTKANKIGSWTQKKKEKIAHWFQDKGKWVKKEILELDCDTDPAEMCGYASKDGGAQVARQALEKCHTVRNSAWKCYGNICNRLNAKPGEPLYDENYIKAVAPLLSKTWTANGVTSSYWQALGCNPSVEPLAHTFSTAASPQTSGGGSPSSLPVTPAPTISGASPSSPSPVASPVTVPAS